MLVFRSMFVAFIFLFSSLSSTCSPGDTRALALCCCLISLARVMFVVALLTECFMRSSSRWRMAVGGKFGLLQSFWETSCVYRISSRMRATSLIFTGSKPLNCKPPTRRTLGPTDVVCSAGRGLFTLRDSFRRFSPTDVVCLAGRELFTLGDSLRRVSRRSIRIWPVIFQPFPLAPVPQNLLATL